MGKRGGRGRRGGAAGKGRATGRSGGVWGDPHSWRKHPCPERGAARDTGSLGRSVEVAALKRQQKICNLDNRPNFSSLYIQAPVSVAPILQAGVLHQQVAFSPAFLLECIAQETQFIGRLPPSFPLQAFRAKCPLTPPPAGEQELHCQAREGWLQILLLASQEVSEAQVSNRQLLGPALLAACLPRSLLKSGADSEAWGSGSVGSCSPVP